MQLALKVQMDYLESLLMDNETTYNGPQSNLEDDIDTYRLGSAYNPHYTHYYLSFF